MSNPHTQREYPKNYAVPRVAYRAQHAHTYTESLVWSFLNDTARVIEPQKGVAGRKIRRVSMAMISHELKMPESTVRDVLRSLVRKHSIVQWNLETGKPQKRVRGDYGGTTVWMIPPYTEVLEVRRNDPALGKVNGHCYVIGKGKRFLTPEEIALWKIDAVVAAQLGKKAAALGTPEDEMSPAPDPPADEPRAAGSASGSSPPGVIDPLPNTIWNAFIDTVRQKNFSRKSARTLVLRVRRMAAKRNENLTDDDIEAAIRQGWENAGRKVNVFGFFEKTLPEKIEAMFEARVRQRENDAAAQAEQARINADKCAGCNGTGFDYSIYDGCTTGAEMEERDGGNPPPRCSVCGGSGQKLDALKRAVNG